MKPARAPGVCYEQGVHARAIQLFDRSHPLSPTVIGAVATGGAIGAGGRWFVAWILERATTPHTAGTWSWSTLIVNLVGCALIGVAARAYAARDSAAWAFAVTGLLGGFTTYSTFAVELNDLIEAGRAAMTIVYSSVTIIGGVAAVVLAGPRRLPPAGAADPAAPTDRDPAGGSSP